MVDRTQSSPWLPFGSGPADAGSRMFCLPFAGGGASNFTAWRKRFPGVGVAPVQYPGRETRLGEPLPRSLAQLVGQLLEAIAPLLDRPYILFGYSMGAKLAYALARSLAERGLRAPAALLVAAHGAPDHTSSSGASSRLPEPQFKEVVRAYGGMPAELLEDEDFCNMILPVLRADFALAAQEVGLAPLDCPVYAYAGTQDASAPASVVAQWQRFTRRGFHLRVVEGGHFFLRDGAAFDATLGADVAAALAPAGAQMAHRGLAESAS